MEDRLKRILIAGSRDYPDKNQVLYFLKRLPKDVEIVSGGARGVDAWAEEYAKDNNMCYSVFYADWKGRGKVAGFERNAKMVEYADEVVAFWDKQSSGTFDTIRKALRAGKLRDIYVPQERIKI